MKKIILVGLLLTSVCFAGLFERLNVSVAKSGSGWVVTNSLASGGGGLVSDNTRWITTLGSSDNDGSMASPLDFSQASFDKCRGKTIIVDSGTYYLSNDVVMSGAEWNDTVILGMGAGSVKLISTNNQKRIFTVNNTCTDITINGMSFESDCAGGGGIHANNSEINNCNFDSCSSSGSGGRSGGGIYANNSEINNCNFNGCSSSGGGGGIHANNSEINNCTFDSCSSSYDGGGIYAEGSVTVNNCTFEDCSSSGSSSGGGGIFSYAAIGDEVLWVTMCSFINCSSSNGESDSSGGGMYVQASIGLIDACYFRGCTAQGIGGAIYSAIPISNFTTHDWQHNKTNGITFAGSSYGVAITTNTGFITSTTTSF